MPDLCTPCRSRNYCCNGSSLTVPPDKVPRGHTGKVLKRVLRERCTAEFAENHYENR